MLTMQPSKHHDGSVIGRKRVQVVDDGIPVKIEAVKVGPGGVDELHEILKKCGEDLKEKFDLGRYWNPPYPLELMRRDAEEREVCAVRVESRTVGTFTVSHRPPPYYDREKYMEMWSDPKGKAMYVGRLAVLPEFQGRGIGTWCIRKIEGLAWASECVAVRLEAYDKYSRLLDFYDKLGYRRRGTIWWRDLGAICYEKVLSDQNTSESPSEPRAGEGPSP